MMQTSSELSPQTGFEGDPLQEQLKAHSAKKNRAYHADCPIHPHCRIPWMSGQMQGALEERLRRGDSPMKSGTYGHEKPTKELTAPHPGESVFLRKQIFCWQRQSAREGVPDLERALGPCSRELSKVCGTGSFTQPSTIVFLSCGCVHASIR